MDDSIREQFGRDFHGVLYRLADNQLTPTRLSKSRDKFSWGITPDDDWLQVGGDQKPPRLRFKLLEVLETRLHFDIFLADGRPATGPTKLGISRNGYLGFYYNATVEDRWAVEPLQSHPNGILCYVRDKQGHRVGSEADTPHFDGKQAAYLNMYKGEPITFLLHPLD